MSRHDHETAYHATGRNDSAAPFKVSEKSWIVAQGKTLIAAAAALIAATTWVLHVNEEGAKIDAMAEKVEEHGRLLREIKSEVDAIAVVCGAKGITTSVSQEAPSRWPSPAGPVTPLSFVSQGNGTGGGH